MIRILGYVLCIAVCILASIDWTRLLAGQKPAASPELHAAAKSGDAETVERVAASGGSIDAPTNGLTPLMTAVAHCHLAVVKVLLGRNASLLPLSDVGGMPVLHLSALCSPAVPLLLEAGADVAAVSARGPGYTALAISAIMNNSAAVTALLQGTGVSVINNEFKIGEEISSPLLSSSMEGYEEVVRALLSRGANTEAPLSIHGMTPLMMAANEGHATVCKVLLQFGARTTPRTTISLTALHLAAARGHTAVVQELLRSGAEVDATTVISLGGFTALMLACSYGHPEVAETLLAAGASHSALSRNGQQPLMMAAYDGHVQLIPVLLAAGADVHAKTPEGFTARTLAEHKGHVVAAAALQAAEEKSIIIIPVHAGYESSRRIQQSNASKS